MSQAGKDVRRHHRELMIELADRTTALVAGQPDADVDALVAFLKDELLPHANGEERHLYAAVEPLIRAHGRATDTMRVDHEFIRDYVREIEDGVEALHAAGPEERPSLLGRLQRLSLQLDAVLRLHLDKEERLYLPLFERHLSAAEQERVLEAMAAPGGEDTAADDEEKALALARIRERIVYKQSRLCED